MVPPLHLTKKIEIVIPSFYEWKDIVLIKEVVFMQFLERLKQLNANSEILKKIRRWYPVVPPLHMTKKNRNFYARFYERKDIVLIKEMVFNNF